MSEINRFITKKVAGKKIKKVTYRGLGTIVLEDGTEIVFEESGVWIDE